MANYFKAKPKKTLPLSALNLTITRLDSHGQGVAQLGSNKNTKPVFIPGALPGEKVKVQIVEQKSKYAKAKLIEVLSSSKDRVQPLCEHFFNCGGCNLQHLSVSAQLSFKQRQVTELFSRQGVSENLPWQTPITAASWHYRRKARLGVQYNKQGQAVIGFRRQNSNQLQPIKHCTVLESVFDDLFDKLNKTVAKLSQSKSIGHIEVIYSHSGENEQQDHGDIVSLVIRQLKPINDADKQCWQDFANQQSAAQTWQIFLDDGEKVSELTQCKTLQFTVDDDVTISFNSHDFIQVNDDINQKMVAQALQWLELSNHDQVLDLFCGLGNFTLPIAKRVKHVVGIEGVDAMVQKAKTNAQHNAITNADFYQADLNNDWLQQPWANNVYTKAILDPARAGALGAIKQLISLNINTILYVSCDPNTLASDSKILLLAGYRMIKISLLDMFTHTKHCETMVLFQRKD